MQAFALVVYRFNFAIDRKVIDSGKVKSAINH